MLLKKGGKRLSENRRTCFWKANVRDENVTQSACHRRVTGAEYDVCEEFRRIRLIFHVNEDGMSKRNACVGFGARLPRHKR